MFFDLYAGVMAMKMEHRRMGLPEEIKLFFERKNAVDRLREKHKLTARDLVTSSKEEIQRRVDAYTVDLENLQQLWRHADEPAQAAKKPKAQDLEEGEHLKGGS